MSIPQPRTIIQSDYLRLVGLKTLAESHNHALADLERAARQITQESADHSRTSDLIYDDNTTVEESLDWMGITVTGDVDVLSGEIKTQGDYESLKHELAEIKEAVRLFRQMNPEPPPGELLDLLHNSFPSMSYGSPEKVAAWLEKGGGG